MQAGFRVDALDVRMCGSRADEQLLGYAFLRPAERVKRKYLDLALGKQELLADLFGVVAHGGLPHVCQALMMVVEPQDLHDRACLHGFLLVG